MKAKSHSGGRITSLKSMSPRLSLTSSSNLAP
jgi:hypothetical protein